MPATSPPGSDDEGSQHSAGSSRGPPSADPNTTVRVGGIAHHSDEEGGGGRPHSLQPSQSLGQTQGWWLLRWASCCHPGRRRRRGSGGGGDAADDADADAGLSWLALQRLKMAEMAAEMERDRDYALYVAQRLDRFLLYFFAAGYTLTIILIFALAANNNTDLSFA